MTSYLRMLAELDAHRSVLIHGPRGCGKSTLFYRLIEELSSAERPAHLEQYEFASVATPILLDMEPIVVNSDTDEEIILADIHTSLFSILERTFLDGDEEDDDGLTRRDRWLLYRVRSCAAFDALRDDLRASRVALDGDPVQLHEAARSADRRTLFQSGLERYSAQTARDKVDDLFSFLTDARTEGVTPCLLIDNVDWASPRGQDTIYDEYTRLHHRFERKLILAINARTTTYLHFKEAHGGNPVGSIIPIGVERGIIAEVVRRRIDLISRVLRGVAGIGRLAFAPRAVLDARVLTLGEDRITEMVGRDMFAQSRDLIAKIGEDFAGQGSFVEDLARWHNHSIRSCTRQFGRILEDLLVGSDPSGVRALPVDARIMRSAGSIRTIQLRHLVFGEFSLADPPQIMELARPSYRKQCRPLLFSMHVLEYLARTGEREVTWGELRALGVGYRLNDAMTLHALNDLNCVRGYESEGLVQISGVQRRVSPTMSDRGIVEIRRAGTYFLENLSVSLEFLSWCAFFNGGFETEGVLKRFDAVSGLDAGVNRLLIACLYVRDVLIAAYAEEARRFLVSNPKQTLKDDRRFEHIESWDSGFGPFTIDHRGGSSRHYALRAAQSLSAQAEAFQSGGLDEDDGVLALARSLPPLAEAAGRQP